MATAFNPGDFPRQLNLGCGKDRRDGFLNIDFNDSHQPDHLSDVTQLTELPSAYYEYILANDVLEHISKLKCLNTLKTWNRVLQMNGRLDMQTTNLLSLLNLFKHENFQNHAGQLTLLRNLFGSQCYKGDYHFMGFTPLLLEYYLSNAGFNIISLTESDGWLFNLSAEKIRDVTIEPLYAINDDVTFIEQVFQTRLQRRPREADIAYYMAILKSGNPREAVVEAIESGLEYHVAQGKHTDCDNIIHLPSDEQFISALYQHLLGRKADADGMAYYLGLLKDGASRKVIIQGLKSSDEYQVLR